MAQIFSQPFFPDDFHLRKEKEDGIPWAIWAHPSLPLEGVGNTCCMTWREKWTFLLPNHWKLALRKEEKNTWKRCWARSWEAWLPKVAQLMKNLHDRWKIEKEVKQWIKSWKFRLHNGWKVEKLPLQKWGWKLKFMLQLPWWTHILQIENCVCKRE